MICAADQLHGVMKAAQESTADRFPLINFVHFEIVELSEVAEVKLTLRTARSSVAPVGKASSLSPNAHFAPTVQGRIPWPHDEEQPPPRPPPG
jgi:hypothetical protein